MRILFILSTVIFPFLFHSQSKLDTLLHKLKANPKEDTTRVNLLNEASSQYYQMDEYKVGLKYSKEALDLATKLKFYKGMAFANVISGNIYAKTGSPQIALKYYKTGLVQFESIKSKFGISNALYSMSLAYTALGEYDKALECSFKGIVLEKSGKDSSELPKRYVNLALTYYRMEENEKSMYYTNEALRLAKYFKNKKTIGSAHNQYGLLYTSLKQADKAFAEYDTAIKIYTEIGALESVANVYSNLGNIYADKHEYKTALENYDKGLKVYQKLGNTYSYLLALYNMSTVYKMSGDVKRAKTALAECETLAKEMRSHDVLKEIHSVLFRVYEDEGNCKESFANYRLAVRYADSITGKEATDNIMRTELKHEYDVALIADSIKSEKEREVVAAKFEQEKTTRIALYIGLALALIAAFFILRNLIQSKKANRIITLQKQEVEGQKLIVDQKNHVIEEKQREIIDSINYAKRIQTSIIASNSILEENLNEFFVLFKPKDIVSGDFYWATKYEHLFYLAVCDSTGHGVPGAFMSLLNIGFLSEAINEKHITDPNKILNRVRERLIATISKDGQQDGFDGVLLCFDSKTKKVTYSAAHNPPLLIREGVITELEKDKMPVGKSPRDHESFNLYSIDLKKGDSLYLYTDGYPDQFGGPNGKKFRYKALEQLLAKSNELSCAQQKELLEETITDWKGELDQIDDILVFGIKV